MLLFLLAACSPPPPQSADHNQFSGEKAYREGLDHLSARHYPNAIRAFNRSLAFHPQRPDAYTAKALAQLENGEKDSARVSIRQALAIDSLYVPAHYVRARYWLAERSYERAAAAFEEILRENRLPDNEANGLLFKKQAFAALGFAREKLGQYQMARAAYQRVLKLDEQDNDASAGLKRLTVIQRLVENYPADFQSLPVQDWVTRSDLAQVLYLDIIPVIAEQDQDKMQIVHASLPGDVTSGHAAAGAIRAVLDYGFLKLYADRRFRPGRPLNRGELALCLQNVLVRVSADSSLAYRYYKDLKSPFSDLPLSHPVFNAAMLLRDCAIMEVADNNSFKPSDQLTGWELIQTIRRLREELQIN